ncbi:MAG: divalent-cation tolerance protein CutA [Deltaproteobacteria bacterium]|nr:MAG: divalent-cation tolerance protein CutA [Deltaproteobacteria bacterium]
MTDLSLVLVTAPNDDVAARLARGLVEGGLAACVNVVPGVRSFYVWKGALEEETEVQLLIKTRRERFDELAAWIGEHHPYEVPEILAVPIENGSPAYLTWVREQTKARAVL